MLETQIKQVARFPGQPEMNPVEHCNAIFLRSTKVLEELEENADEQVEVTWTPSTRGRMRKNPKDKMKNLIS